MTARARTQWRPDPRGYYVRQIGWKISPTSGRHFQHKFTLGKDLKEAQWRDARLFELWQRYEMTRDEDRPLWPTFLLDIAKRIAKGERRVLIPIKPGENAATYAQRIARYELAYPVVAYDPADRRAYEVGREALCVLQGMDVDVDDVLSKPVSFEKLKAKLASDELLMDVGLSIETSHLDAQTKARAREKHEKQVLSGQNPVASQAQNGASSGTLYAAIREYIRWVRREHHDHDHESLSAWGNTQRRQMETIMDRHEDCLLAAIDYDRVDQMFGYWRSRPRHKNGKKRITTKSAGNYISQLGRFFDWLHTSRFEWRKPRDYSDIKTSVQKDAVERQAGLEQVATFSLRELSLLHQYANPFERLLVLLGLNCGFGMAETASLLVSEVQLFTAHAPRFQELLGYETTDRDSFVKRVRRKSCVYGEHILFPPTVQALQWALARRKEQPDFSDKARLLLNEKGQPYDAPTKSGNRNQQIPNAFARLLKRIEDDGNEIRKLSFGKLRKTASDLIRRHSDGEIAGVFLCHGKAVETDDLADQYTNRPIGKVFRAIRDVEQYLDPIFAASNVTATSSRSS